MIHERMDISLDSLKKRYVIGIWFLCFAVISFFSFLYFIIEGKSFVLAGDGMTQHLTALAYYGEMLRKYIAGIFASGFKDIELPQWDLNLGFGSDILTTLHYYVIGEPLTLLSVFVPKEHTQELYTVLILLRIFLAGLAFLAYCRFHKHGTFSSFCGAIIYTFCGFTFYCAVRHPYFEMPLIYLPLLCIGIDKILKKESLLFFSAVVFLACASNFYFFYMLTFALFVYALVRFFCTFPKKEWKSAFRYVLPCAAGYSLGVFMAAAVFFPQVYGFLTSARNGQEEYFPPLYSLIYYIKGALSFIAPPTFASYSTLGLASPALPLVLLALIQKDKKALQLRIAIGLGVVILAIPALAYALNGFKALTNRWVFMLVFPLSIATVHGIQILRAKGQSNLTGKTWMRILFSCMFLSLIVLAASIKSLKVRQEFALSYATLLVSAALLLAECKKKQSSYIFLLPLVAVSAMLNGVVRYAPWGLDYMSRFLPGRTAREISAEYNYFILDSDKNIWRTETSSFANGNSPALSGLYGTTYYWAMNNQNLVSMYNDLYISQSSDMRSGGTENDPILSALFNVKYSYEKTNLPPSFCFSEAAGLSHVYKNDLYVPFGYSYQKVVKKSQYDTLSPLDKRCTLLFCAVVPDDFESLQSDYTNRTYLTNVDFTFSDKDAKNVSGKQLSVNKTSDVFSIRYEKSPDSLHYLYIKNLSFTTDINEGTVLFVTTNGVKRAYEINGIGDSTGHNFLVFLGESAGAELSFGEEGMYSYEEMAVQSIKKADIKAGIDGMRQDTLSSSSFSKNTIKGTVDVSSPVILCLSLLYTKHCKVLLDGTEHSSFPTQSGLTGILVPAGKHTVELHYTTPFLYESCLLALLAWVIFLIIAVKKILSSRLPYGRNR